MEAQYVLVLAALAAISTMLSGCGAAQNMKEAAVEKFVSPAAIDGFITVNHDDQQEGCNSNLQMSNITGNIWWPGCGLMKSMDDFDKCDSDGCVKKQMVEDMDAFNDKNPGKLVTYKSRAGKDSAGKDIEVVQLTGWWLPAPNAQATTPRIVVQHGFKGNSNKYRQMFVAYLLRKLGYSVLVNNLRDHCYSEESEAGIVGWGHAYPLDELGAWDYAKDHAAEKIDKSKVGILGFSMGAFTTANAFGVDGDVPAAWIDGPPITPRAGFEVGFKKAAGQAAKHISDEVWQDVLDEAKKKGVDLNEHLPEKELPTGPDTKRPVFVTANKKDGTVDYSSGEALVAILQKYPEKYDLKEFWTHDGECVEGEAHCLDHVRHPVEYSAKLCKFWSDVFGTDPTCGQAADQKNSDEPKAEEKKAAPKEEPKAEEKKADLKEEPKAEEKEDDPKKLYEQRGVSLEAAPSSFNFIVAACFVASAAGLFALSRRMRFAGESRHVAFHAADAEQFMQGAAE